MTWADFYLICFVVGFVLSVLSFVAGELRWHVHLPHFHGHPVATHGGTIPAGTMPAGTTPAGQGTAHPHHGHLSPFNLATLAAFLAWFGGCGYLLTRYSTFWIFTGLGLSTLAGLAGASIVFLFLSRVLMSEDGILDPADYEMVGVLGRTSVPIRADGTGEIIYSQAGTRRPCGARTEDGSAISKGIEVVVTRYEKGIAYVRPWSEMAGEDPQPADSRIPPSQERS